MRENAYLSQSLAVPIDKKEKVMPKSFSFGAMIAGLAMLVASAASSATLNGANFQVDYMLPDTSTVYPFTDGPVFGTVGVGTDATIVVEGVTSILLDFDALSLGVTLNTVLNNPTWNSSPFNGLRITFSNLMTPITSFALTANSFSPITTSFTANQLFINWAGASYVDGSDAGFAVELAPIPLPAALPLLMAGVAAMGALRLRQKRQAA